MKHLFIFLFVAFCQLSFAQDNIYLLFEYMVVDGEQSQAYNDTEEFWSKIHQERVENGDIIGWDLWSLQPGGEWQDFQFLTVQVYDDPVKMMEGTSWDRLLSAAKKAYPEMSEDEINLKISHSEKTRDLAVRQYLHQIASTDGDFDMPEGTVCRINMMKTEPGGGSDYVTAETKHYQPLHQKAADKGHLGSWEIAEVISPSGSDIYANYVTFDMYKSFDQMFNSPMPWDGLTDKDMEVLNKATETRDLKKTYLATLIKKVR